VIRLRAALLFAILWPFLTDYEWWSLGYELKHNRAP
jgi:hypothetical protein